MNGKEKVAANASKPVCVWVIKQNTCVCENSETALFMRTNRGEWNSRTFNTGVCASSSSKAEQKWQRARSQTPILHCRPTQPRTGRPGHRMAPWPEAAFYPTQLSSESDVDLVRNPRDKISHGHANLWSLLSSGHSFLCPLIKCAFTLKGKMCTLSFGRQFNFQSLQLSLI